MKIALTSVLVDDQASALAFYTQILGFVKKQDIDLGEARWLTVVSPEGPSDIELLLEPSDNPAAIIYRQALVAQGIPLTAFAAADVQQEYERLKRLGVVFTMEPTAMGETVAAIFDDTCGNLIQIFQV